MVKRKQGNSDSRFMMKNLHMCPSYKSSEGVFGAAGVLSRPSTILLKKAQQLAAPDNLLPHSSSIEVVKVKCAAVMIVKLVPLLGALQLVVGVSGSDGTTTTTTTSPPMEGCISRPVLQKPTLHSEINLWVVRHGRDVVVRVDHSEGSCTLLFNDPDLDDMWVSAKLQLKNGSFVLFINKVPQTPRRGCVESLRGNSIKTVSVANAVHLLPACTKGPAVYQISKAQEDVVIPWYEEEARLLLEPQEDTQIGVQVGGQELVLCSSKGRVAALHNATACTGGVGTAGLTLTIPKSNTVIKVITADGQKTETQITNGVAGVPPTVKNTLITGTVIMKQCLANCDSGKDVPGDCACTGYLVAMVVFLLLSAGLAAAVAYLLYRGSRGYMRAGGKEDHGTADK